MFTNAFPVAPDALEATTPSGGGVAGEEEGASVVAASTSSTPPPTAAASATAAAPAAPAAASTSAFPLVPGGEDKEVKLFVGQIPKDMDEEYLLPFFSTFGQVSDFSIIRDKTNQSHKGCAFVTYASHSSAALAVDQLHDKVRLPNSANPLQVRVAENHAEREHKLFIGMLPKTVNEEDLHDMFVPYGELREVHIIRGGEGSSKGCAFVKFADRDAAMVAIEIFNDLTPVGSTRPLVVKFADTKKSGKTEEGAGGSAANQTAMQAKQHQQQQQQQNPEFWQQQQQQPAIPGAGQRGEGPIPQGDMLQYGRGAPGPLSGGAPPPPGPEAAFYGAGSGAQYLDLSGAQPGFAPPDAMGRRGGGMQQQQQQQPPQAHFMRDPQQDLLRPRVSAAAAAAAASSGRLSAPTDEPYDVRDYYPQDGQKRQDAGSRPPEGPSGANLFIYHLPRDLTDADLATLFAPFGNVISAKVFVDKKTSDSKGFGFVSYDLAASAESAIASMNGFQIGSKRLKVQHKRTGDMSYGGPFNPMAGQPNMQRYDPRAAAGLDIGVRRPAYENVGESSFQYPSGQLLAQRFLATTSSPVPPEMFAQKFQNTSPPPYSTTFSGMR